MGLRETKKQATRTALSWAAIRLVVERGYDRVLVEDIAAAAGVSPRTYNNYFSSKAEAVAARHRDRCFAVADSLRARPAGEPLWDAITQAVLEQFAPGPEVLAHPEPDHDSWAAGLRRMMAVPALQAEILRGGADATHAIGAAVADRTGLDVDRDLYPKLVAAALLAANDAVVAHWLSGTGLGRDSVPELLVEALGQLRAGLPQP
ncbi:MULTISPECIES: acyl-CoA-like ligand-binding transcription factor [Actinoplanes]|uniref:TetR family transcriptional regulator n=2 Tax=Actinoplanes TaxID=1865 RepID=A0A101JIF6_9ACTN|nr:MULTISPECIES: TetR family transcriptional regulator [Actinoplanes]KUL27394.1 TetR family transcriptional regulator [Actinoplanes awajinensis subsp. mycoplanecinus]GIE70434.1 TetR family transcriptional regulator [Actinoplanes palleronii]